MIYSGGYNLCFELFSLNLSKSGGGRNNDNMVGANFWWDCAFCVCTCAHVPIGCGGGGLYPRDLAVYSCLNSY